MFQYKLYKSTSQQPSSNFFIRIGNKYMVRKFVLLIGVEAVALDEKEILRNVLMFSMRS